MKYPALFSSAIYGHNFSKTYTLVQIITIP